MNEHTGRACTNHTFQHMWRQVAPAAGISAKLQFRDLRATALTEISDSGGDIIGMSTHGGHKTAEMGRRYARATPEQFARVAAQRVVHLATKRKKPIANR